MATILANRLVPGPLDRYLARTNYEAQQAAELGPQAATPNIWDPPDGDPGAHGPFDDRAHPRSVQAWAAERRTVLRGGAALAAAGAVAWAAARRSARP